jgi:hypothetical protein
MEKTRDEAACHFVAASDKDGDGASVGALLDHQHFVARRPKRHLPYNTSLA